MSVWETIHSIKRENLADEIVETLKSVIQSGALKSGDRLPSELELAEKFEVGRGTVREALRVLEAIGLVERSKRGTFVAGRSGKVDGAEVDGAEVDRAGEPAAHREPAHLLRDYRLADLVEARKVLEAEMAALAAARATDEDVERLRSCLQRMEQSAHREGGLTEFIEADASFHLAVATAAGNQAMQRMLELVRAELVEEIGETLSRDAELIDRALENHTRIFHFIASEEVEMARKEMLAHLSDISRIIMRNHTAKSPE